MPASSTALQKPRAVKTDSRGRVNIGKEKAGRKYKAEFKEDGVVVLTPVARHPATSLTSAS